MKLIFLRIEHWSVLVSVVFFFPSGCILKEVCMYFSEDFKMYFYNNLSTIDEEEYKMTSCKSHR